MYACTVESFQRGRKTRRAWESLGGWGGRHLPSLGKEGAGPHGLPPQGLLGDEASRDEDTERLLSVLGSLALRHEPRGKETPPPAETRYQPGYRGRGTGPTFSTPASGGRKVIFGFLSNVLLLFLFPMEPQF